MELLISVEFPFTFDNAAQEEFIETKKSTAVDVDSIPETQLLLASWRTIHHP
jgi:hypothetical protein